jgi:hypothetical protein
MNTIIPNITTIITKAPPADIAQSISLGEGESLVNIGEEENPFYAYSEGESIYKKNYLLGEYRTVVIVFEGKVVISPYDEKGIKETESVALTAGEKSERTGEIK